MIFKYSGNQSLRNYYGNLGLMLLVLAWLYTVQFAGYMDDDDAALACSVVLWVWSVAIAMCLCYYKFLLNVLHLTGMGGRTLHYSKMHLLVTYLFLDLKQHHYYCLQH